MPFAIYLAVKFRKRVWWLAFVVLLLGEFASGSKTGMLGVAAMVGVFLWLRPRQTLRFWPAIIPMVVLVHVVAPGALGGVYGGFFPSGGLVAQQGATVHGAQLSRASRVPTALHEFSEHNPLLGEGYGTRVTGGDGNFQASTAQTSSTVPTAASLAMSRGQLVKGVNSPVLDDQWLKTLLETGILGVLAWGWLFFRAIRRLGARAKTERESPDGLLPIALAAALLGFAIAMGTYDAFSFVQATALTFILIGFSSIVLHLAPAKPDDAVTVNRVGDSSHANTYAVAVSRGTPGRANRAAEKRRDASHSPSRTSSDPKPRSRSISLDRRRFVFGRGGERLYHIRPVHSTESDVAPNLKIERQVDTRGIEFEPADLGRRPQRSAPSTPEELLDERATLLETRRSAQTAGVKAGATRRIRKIEAALTDRGVEFQPAPLSPSRGSSAAPSTPEQLLAARAAWIKAHQAAGPGPAPGRQQANPEHRAKARCLRHRVRAGRSWAPPTALGAIDSGRAARRARHAAGDPEICADGRGQSRRHAPDPQDRGGTHRPRRRVPAGATVAVARIVGGSIDPGAASRRSRRLDQGSPGRRDRGPAPGRQQANPEHRAKARCLRHRVRAGRSWAPPTALGAIDREEMMKLTMCRPRRACWSMVQVRLRSPSLRLATGPGMLRVTDEHHQRRQTTWYHDMDKLFSGLASSLAARKSPRPNGQNAERILLVACGGGHLLELLALEHAWRDLDHRFVTQRTVDATHLLADEDVVYGYGPRRHSISCLLRNLRLAWATVREYKPDVILSTGAHLEVPFFIVGRLHRLRLVHVESLTRLERPSLSGRMVYPLADAFFVQWPTSAAGRRAIYAGSIL